MNKIKSKDIGIHYSDHWSNERPWIRVWIEADDLEHAQEIVDQILDNQKLRPNKDKIYAIKRILKDMK